MRLIGIILAVVGVIGLTVGGIQYTKQHTVLDVGPLQAKVDEKKTLPIPPLAGGVALALGVVLVLADRRRA